MAREQADDSRENRTTDHALVQSLVEDRGGYPAHEPQTEGQGDRALLRIGDTDEAADLEEMSWETFLDIFEEKDLAYVYDPGGDGVGRLDQRDA
ncbi:hypothetical protein [Haloarchaeobius sp. HRN-SO-5]|uniref:hypothetical protein n=1 Tax=Haloarchaeobius sp. HRN-SO-5 TaxID=3446118 RepID=UPI003EB8E853